MPSLRARTVLPTLSIAVLVACGGRVDGPSRGVSSGDDPHANDPSTSGGDDRGDSLGSPAANAPERAPVGSAVCCPPDAVRSGSMHLGGQRREGGCFRTHDFWCSTNWRIEKDDQGCPIWRYDVRAPAPDETPSCQPAPPAPPCTPGSYVYCRCANGADGTALCREDATLEACACL